MNILEGVDPAILQEAKGMEYLRNRENLMNVLNDVGIAEMDGNVTCSLFRKNIENNG